MSQSSALFNRVWTTGKKELPKMLLDAAVSSLGFLLALLIARYVDDRKEMDTFATMLTAVRAEANNNADILENSYGHYFMSGLVLKDFDYSTARQMLSTPVFMKHAKPDQIQILSSYIQHLSLANSYRDILERLTLQDQEANKAWIENVEGQQISLLPSVGDDVKKVSKLGK